MSQGPCYVCWSTEPIAVMPRDDMVFYTNQVPEALGRLCNKCTTDFVRWLLSERKPPKEKPASEHPASEKQWYDVWGDSTAKPPGNRE